MQVFRRRNLQSLWITLQSNEILGLLDSSYLKDYFGNDGQVTLFHVESQQRIPLPMNEVSGLSDPTPTIPHDVFTGVVDLSTVQDGSYKIEGLVRDVADNYTVLSEVNFPTTQEKTIPLDLRITNEEIVLIFPGVSISMGVTFSATLPSIGILFQTPLNKSISVTPKLNKVSLFRSNVVKYHTIEANIPKGVALSGKIRKELSLSANISTANG